jgi:hypothetical protein
MSPSTIWIGITVLALGSLGLGYLTESQDLPGIGARDATYEVTLASLREFSVRSQAMALAPIFSRASREDLDGITRAFETTYSGKGPSVMSTQMLGELWARHDPSSALERAAGWDYLWYRRFLPPLMNAWARRDGSAAQERTLTIEGEKLRRSAEEAVALGRFDARGDAGWAGYWADWPLGEGVLFEIFEGVARREGLASLIDRVETLPEDAPHDFRAQAIRAVAGLGGQIDPLETLPFVERHADSSIEGLRNIRAPFVDAWSQTDPRAALDWLMTQPSGSRRHAAMRIGFRLWALTPSSSADAVEWLEARPEKDRRPVLDFYALALVHVDPSRAVAAAEQIEAANRDNIVKRVKMQVAVRARAAARGRSMTTHSGAQSARTEADQIDLEPPPASETLTIDERPPITAETSETLETP